MPRALALAQESVDILKIRDPLGVWSKKTFDQSFILMKSEIKVAQANQAILACRALAKQDLPLSD